MSYKKKIKRYRESLTQDAILKPTFSAFGIVKWSLIHNVITVLVVPMGHRQITLLSCVST